jgi:hypothetical protein
LPATAFKTFALVYHVRPVMTTVGSSNYTNNTNGNLAAITLDKIKVGIKPDLQKYYRNAKSKKFLKLFYL